MRDIKFRCWDIEGFMFEPTEISLRQNENFNIQKDWGKMAWREDGSGGLGRVIGDECFLMQYTGLKDKNGVEIYEGDIVESKHGQIGVIKFKNYGFCVDFEKEGYDSYLIHVSKGEVVGNVYENKELLGE